MSDVPTGLGPAYHERQQSALCLKHTLNNLLQTSYFSKRDLDRIARALPRQGFRLFCPHKWFCFGNYDVNVMMMALDCLNKDVRWHDERDEAFAKVDFSKCWAILLNTHGRDQWQNLVTESRHWCGIKNFQGCWYSLDSILPFPQQITQAGSAESGILQLKEYLFKLKQADSSSQIFIITEKPGDRLPSVK